jgi:pyruvate ferredoxin oxidoreductase beta subunit
LGWAHDPGLTITVARLAIECGLFPLFEAEFGRVTGRTTIRRRVPVERYLELQGRFKHLFSDPPNREALAAIQAIADRHITEYGLIEGGGAGGA